MRLNIVVLIVFGIVLSGCNLTVQKSGIEIITNPTAKVFIDGKEAGMTPYKNNSLKPGEVQVKLVARDREWIKKVHLENGANTVINREFATSMETDGGYILYFESTGDIDKAGILISSTPDRATIAIDDEIKGYSPIRLENVGEGDKKLVISYPGHKSISTFVKFVGGYQLVINGDLPVEEMVEKAEVLSITPTQSYKQVTIKDTETGWLRVRKTASSGSEEIGKVNTGDKFKLIVEEKEWYQIEMSAGKNGWISTKYAEKLP